MKVELERNSLVLIEVRSRHLPGGTEKKYETLKIANVWADIQTEYFPTTSLERYR
jgi:hypothetical protein